MKKIILCCLLLSTILAAKAGKSYFSKFSGPYPGQKPTGADSLSGQSATAVPLMLTYVANMGVMVSSGDFKVLIDGLFDKPSQYYRVPSPDTRKAVMKGEAPFDGIDLVLVTHKHSDHFDAALAVRYMEARAEPILVAPADAVEAMRQAAYDWSRIEPRLVPVDLKVGKNVKREVARIPLTIVRTLHGNEKAPMNLMYLIEVNGWRVFHEGDWLGNPDDFHKFGLGTSPIDLAIVGYAWPVSPNPLYNRFLYEVTKPSHIALGHLFTNLESVAEDRIEKVRKHYKDIFVLLPDMPVKIFLPRGEEKK